MPPIFRAAPVAVLALSFVLAQSATASGRKVIVGIETPVDRRAPMHEIDHAAWHTLLQKHVDAIGRVDYRSWHRSRDDMAALDGYLNELSRGDMGARTSREGYLAFWINAYNAVTIKGILREYPTTSIRNHTSKLGGYNIWKDLLLQVSDKQISLDEIEHEILRKLDEPRIHFAVVCASHSCPRLLNEAYTGELLESQLVANTRQFFSVPGNFQYRDGRFELSAILKWYGDDFGENRADLLRAIAPYLPSGEAQRAASGGEGRVSYLAYDWSLNEQ